MKTKSKKLTKTKTSLLLRPKNLGDATQDYIWQTDPQLCQLNATLPVSMPFALYASAYELELENPRLGRQWAIEVDGEHIGNCAVYNFDYQSGSAEIGILIGHPKHRRKGWGTLAVKELLNRAFADPHITVITLKTLEENVAAYRFFTSIGFQPIGKGYLENTHYIFMEISSPVCGKIP